MTDRFDDEPAAGRRYGYASPAPKPTGLPLAPLLAGARARGVADGLDWLGLAAVLFDDRGEVMHVNACAAELMGDHLHLDRGRLRAQDLGADAALDLAVADAIAIGATTHVAIDAGAGLGRLVARVAPMETPDPDPFQLLRAVAVLRRATAARH